MTKKQGTAYLLYPVVLSGLCRPEFSAPGRGQLSPLIQLCPEALQPLLHRGPVNGSLTILLIRSESLSVEELVLVAGESRPDRKSFFDGATS